MGKLFIDMPNMAKGNLFAKKCMLIDAIANDVPFSIHKVSDEPGAEIIVIGSADCNDRNEAK